MSSKNYVDNQKHNICEMKSYLRKNNPFFDRGGSGWNRFFVIYTIFNENIKYPEKIHKIIKGIKKLNEKDTELIINLIESYKDNNKKY